MIEELVIMDDVDGGIIEVPRKEYDSAIRQMGYTQGRLHLQGLYSPRCMEPITTESSK
jgi:hypothetical protein